MALELKASSGWWYGRFSVKGRLRRVNLGVKVEGRRPASITGEGDTAFERSRGKAEARHAEVLKDVHSQKNGEELAQRVMHFKIGTRVESVMLATLPDVWAKLPRKRVPTAQHTDATLKRVKKFVAYMVRHHRDVTELAMVQAGHVHAFLDEESARGISARTWNRLLSLLKGVFRVLEPGADAYRNFLLRTPQRVEETVHRQPFAVEEMQAVLAAAQSDGLIRSLILTAVCTAMRRGDCARLKWSSVDLKSGFITVKTGKTGETVEIPILPLLRDVLKGTHPAPGNEAWVFPEAAELYEKNPGQLDRRLKVVLNRAGFVDRPGAERVRLRADRKPSLELPMVPAAEVSRRGFEAIEKLPISTEKRETMRCVFQLYMAGKGLPTVAKELSVSKSTVSLHLREIERAIGVAVVRWQEPAAPAVVRGNIHAENGATPRLKRGTLKGWHSFRTTFCTLALSAGMPMELVQRVTGHKTVSVVLKHYFKPGREQFRQAMLKAMPGMLTEGQVTPAEEMRQIVKGLKASNLGKGRARLMELLDQVS